MSSPLFIHPVPTGTKLFTPHGLLSPRRPTGDKPRAPPIHRARYQMLSGATDPLGEQLVRAAMQGDLPSITSLLSSGASASYQSTKNDSLMTALMWAASEGHVAIAKQLLSSGADPNSQSTEGMTALLFAFENLPSANPRPTPPAGFPGSKRPGPVPPQIPITKRITGHSDVGKLLLVAGADPTVRNEVGETLLHAAARKARTEWVDVMVSAGVDVNAQSRGYLETAMHLAAKEGHAEVVRALGDLGADVNVRSRYGWTPLVWAAACANAEAVGVLLELGADPNLPTLEGKNVQSTTPLKEARKSSKPVEISKLLIRGGAIE